MNLTKQEIIFLDKVAIEACKLYMAMRPPSSDEGPTGRKTLAEASYKVAVQMLKFKRQGLEPLLEEVFEYEEKKVG